MNHHAKRTLAAVILGAAALAFISCTGKPKATDRQGSNGSQEVSVTDGAQPPVMPPYTEISLKCQGERVPILMYHDVVKSHKDVYFDCTQAEFEDQMKWISDQGITPITLDQLYNHLTKGDVVPDKSIVITFDDNYQGFYDVALPILERYKYPAAMFVHTGFVGDKKGKHPKMDWPTLKELIKNPLVTIGSHTVTHPADITAIAPSDQLKELRDSKATLEQQLGKPMPYLAYPDGKNDQTVQDLAKSCGYKMAFTMVNQPAEESPSIMCVGRYIQSKYEKAWDDRQRSLDGGALGIFRGQIADAPVTYKEGPFGRTTLALVIGGIPESLMSLTREGVVDFIHRTPGAVAGINGGFFALAAISSTDNQMVGPCKTHEFADLTPGKFPEIWPKLHNRPLIIWGPHEMAILPFEAETMNSDAALRDFMPDYTDAFLAGVWLVHKGVARTKDDLDTFASKDIEDPRRRAFIGIDAAGHIVLGASTDSASSEMVAEAAAQAGVQEAVLLDSGFSTSLVYGEDVKASGHSTSTLPSRPVPHAIVLIGKLDPTTAALGVSTFKPGPPEEEVKPKKRRRRHKKTDDESVDPNAVPPDTAAGPPVIPPPDDKNPPDKGPPSDPGSKPKSTGGDQ